MTDRRPRTALVTDWLTTRGGAARVVEAVAERRPGVPIYTLVHDPQALRDSPLAAHPIATSFLQRLPGIRRRYRATLPLMPLAIERLDLRSYDLVLSLSHAVAKGILTSAHQLHVCYVFTPVRYGWDLQRSYLESSRLGRLSALAHPVLHYLRLWDLASSRRPDVLVACSHYVARRIRKLYGRPARVIHPPVDVERFSPRAPRENFYLTVSRLVPYKKTELLIEAFRRLDLPLVVIGDGPERRRLAKMAGGRVRLLGWQSDATVTAHLERCRAFVFAADEDFGIAPVEAMAAGAPVIAYGRGGVTESVVPGVSGLFFDAQDVTAIVGTVQEFERRLHAFPAAQVRRTAEPFARVHFQRRFEALVAREWQRFAGGGRLAADPAAEARVG